MIRHHPAHAECNHEEIAKLALMIECYRLQYGDDTPALFSALQTPQKKVALINPFLSLSARENLIADCPQLNISEHLAWLPENCAPHMLDGLLSHYFLDLSSVLAPLLLPLNHHRQILDMCAAPGGKLLVMISRLINQASYFANDISYARSMRLRKVVDSYLPKSFIDSYLSISTKDAISFGLRHKENFDAVLLDAPCSSESHVVNDSKLLRNFTGLRKTLPQRQYALLSSALLATRPSGHIMYATCTINHHENQGVIRRVLLKKSHLVKLVPLNSPIGDHGEFGVSILPHRHGAGPAFFSLLQRV